MAPQPLKVKRYKDFLTPALHQRFVNGVSFVLLICWLQAALLSSSGFIWALSPFGLTGLRTLLLLCPCLGIFILRTSGIHFGARTTRSGFETLYQSLVSLRAAIVLVWYLFATSFFAEVYIWSSGENGNLGWVDHGRAYERPRMNENPVILRTFFVLIALMQTILHVYRDTDRIAIDPSTDAKPVSEASPTVNSIASAAFLTPIARGVVNTTLAALVSITPLYFIILRRISWPIAYFFGSALFPSLPDHAAPPGLSHVPTLIWQAATSAVMLTALLEVSNAVYTIFMVQPPLKRGQPLTNEIKDNAGVVISRSPDPNASLIEGLRSKRETVHNSAIRELHLICTQFADRRKTIFTEVDRADGSTWSQISQLCLAEIATINNNITKSRTPPLAPQQQGPQPGLPRIAGAAVQQGDILNKPRPDLAGNVSSLARSAGLHPGARDPVSPAAKQALTWGMNQVLTKEQQQQLSREGITKETNGQMIQFLRTPLGEPFRESFSRIVNATIFGTPYSAQTSITFAIRSLTALLKASLEEDICGVVAKDVPAVFRALVSTNGTVRGYVETLAPAWTDVAFRKEERQVKEVSELTSELHTAIEAILLVFGEYATSLGITRKELREAKEAIGMKTSVSQEMMQI